MCGLKSCELVCFYVFRLCGARFSLQGFPSTPKLLENQEASLSRVAPAARRAEVYDFPASLKESWFC